MEHPHVHHREEINCSIFIKSIQHHRMTDNVSILHDEPDSNILISLDDSDIVNIPE